MQVAARRNNILQIATGVSVLLFIAATLMTFFYPGTERTMGEVQRVFYIHLGTFFGAFVVFIGAVIAGIAYLKTGKVGWDHLGLACIEVGIWFSTITVVTGMVWARPTWGSYWTWDPRLTTVSIMWLTYAAYMFLRGAIEEIGQRRRFAAIYGILAFGSVILTVVIIRVRPDVIHPVVAGPSAGADSAVGSFNMSPRITQTVLFNIFAYVVIAITLVWHRIRLEGQANALEARKQEFLMNV